MGAYSNYVKDFPKRCQDLLAYEWQAEYDEREVTLLLSVATSGFIVPYERLNKQDHPSRDGAKYAPARRKLAQLGSGRFVRSTLAHGVGGHEWEYFEGLSLPSTNEVDPWQWKELKEAVSTIEIANVDTILSHVRNALAHGNIWSVGDPITHLIFLSKQSKKNDAGERYYTGKWNVIRVSVPALRQFLLMWIDFLGGLDLGLMPIAKSLEDEYGEVA